MAEILADDICIGDRRQDRHAGRSTDRDAVIAEFKPVLAAGREYRRDRLATLRRSSRTHAVVAFRGETSGPRRSTSSRLTIIEIDADERIVAAHVFDLDDFDAAIAELDARYLAGEAAAHAHTWSVITAACPRSTGGDCSRLRRIGSTSTTGEGSPFAPGDLPAYTQYLVESLARRRQSTSRPCIG